MRCANTGKSSNEGNLVHPENFHPYERIFSCLQYRPTFSALRREITYTGITKNVDFSEGSQKS